MPPADAKARVLPPPAPLVAVAGWLIPGAGYWLLGQRGRALTICITIVLLFVMGLLIGGMRLFEPTEGLWHVQQVLAGPMALIAKWVGQDFPFSHSRLNEIGTLYTAIAGDLSLLAIIDSTYRAARRESRNA
jgi:hypothetical protein